MNEIKVFSNAEFNDISSMQIKVILKRYKDIYNANGFYKWFSKSCVVF